MGEGEGQRGEGRRGEGEGGGGKTEGGREAVRFKCTYMYIVHEADCVLLYDRTPDVLYAHEQSHT